MPTATPGPNARIDTDALIIGAGPVGLFQVFELGLQDMRAHVIDALPYAGGQCVELYADKAIYDIPGTPRCTGRELTQRLLMQAAPFDPVFHFNQLVSAITRRDDGRIAVATQEGLEFLTKTLFIAAGVGAFVPKPFKAHGAEQLSTKSLQYALQPIGSYAGQHVIVAGDGDAALTAALRLSGPEIETSQRAASVTLLHRRDAFSAQPEYVSHFRQRVSSGQANLRIGQPLACSARVGVVQELHIVDSHAQTHVLPCDALISLQGLSPKLGPVAEWGLALERKQLVVDTETFATSAHGIFAVGDINTYPGKKKLILCGFHEATLAAFGAANIVFPNRKTTLQYTTSSTQLQQSLGVYGKDH